MHVKVTHPLSEAHKPSDDELVSVCLQQGDTPPAHFNVFVLISL